MPHESGPIGRFREACPPEAGERGVAALASAQGGQVSVRQLEAAGFGEKAIRVRVKDGRLHRAGRGVYQVGYERRDDLARAWRAVLTYPGTALSFRSSAWGHGLRFALGAPIHLSSMTNRRDRPGVRVHEAAQVELEIARGLPCTPLPQTLLDCATVCTPEELANLIDRAEELEIFDLRPILPLLDGRKGSAALRAALTLHRAQTGGTRSELERRFKALLKARGLPPAAHGRNIGPFWIDAVYEQHRIAIELDGGTHLTRRSRQRDIRRDAWLQRHGWRAVRFSWFDVVHDPAYVIETLSGLLAAPTLAA